MEFKFSSIAFHTIIISELWITLSGFLKYIRLANLQARCWHHACYSALHLNNHWRKGFMYKCMKCDCTIRKKHLIVKHRQTCWVITCMLLFKIFTLSSLCFKPAKFLTMPITICTNSVGISNPRLPVSNYHLWTAGQLITWLILAKEFQSVYNKCYWWYPRQS